MGSHPARRKPRYFTPGRAHLAHGCLISTAIFGLAGCGGPARIYPPDIDAAAAGAAAVKQLDRDGDQLLSAEELKSCHGIHTEFVRYDKDGDNRVSAEEIATRIGELSRDGKTGLYSIVCKVMLDGAPFSGAEVEFIPEGFLGDAVQTARGVTNSRGMVRVSVDDITSSNESVAVRGVQPGIYRVAISGTSEAITARYGKGDALGLEVSEECLGTNIVFRLTSK